MLSADLANKRLGNYTARILRGSVPVVGKCDGSGGCRLYRCRIHGHRYFTDFQRHQPVARSRDRQAELRLPDIGHLLSAHRSSHVLLPRTASAEPDEDPKPSKLQ